MSHRLHALLLGLGALGAGCAALTLTFFRSGGRLNIEATFVAAFVALGLLWILAGLVAWWKRPENRTGALMTAAGFLVFTWLPERVGCFASVDCLRHHRSPLPRGGGAPVRRVSPRAALLDDRAGARGSPLRRRPARRRRRRTALPGTRRPILGDRLPQSAARPRRSRTGRRDRACRRFGDGGAVRGRRRPSGPSLAHGERARSPRYLRPCSGVECSCSSSARPC